MEAIIKKGEVESEKEDLANGTTRIKAEHRNSSGETISLRLESATEGKEERFFVDGKVEYFVEYLSSGYPKYSKFYFAYHSIFGDTKIDIELTKIKSPANL